MAIIGWFGFEFWRMATDAEQSIFITHCKHVNGGLKACQWGGAKEGQFGLGALERVALI